MLKNLRPFAHIKDVYCIDYERLYKAGIKGFIFDVDNTLVHHGDESNEKVETLFRDLHHIGLKTMLLSDNSKERIESFTKNIDCPYIYEAGKPQPHAYYQALETLGLKPSEVFYVGDQIFLDILGANRAGIRGILVDFIRIPEVTKLGKKRYLEKALLLLFSLSKRERLNKALIIKENDCGKAKKAIL